MINFQWNWNIWKYEILVKSQRKISYLCPYNFSGYDVIQSTKYGWTQSNNGTHKVKTAWVTIGQKFHCGRFFSPIHC